jgi:nucleotide-binding universal stress UspA family protein
METTAKKTIMVTWDFTDKAEFALEHAIQLSKPLNTDVELVHIVKKDKEIEEATKKLNDVVEATRKKFQVKPLVLVRVGNIFTTITELAVELNAEMVIMGTHGMKGMQKLIGSWALKVIAGSKVPFIVVQAPPATHGFEKIVFPLDFRKENKEKINWMYYVARLYHSKFFIIKSKTSDARFVKGIHSNLMFTKKFLDNNLIPYEIETAPGKKDFATEIIEYAHNIGADLLLIMTTKDINITDYVIGAQEQMIISNKYQIPVMCINPRPGKIGGGFSATGG